MSEIFVDVKFPDFAFFFAKPRNLLFSLYTEDSQPLYNCYIYTKSVKKCQSYYALLFQTFFNIFQTFKRKFT